jgi:hypothetical protein
LRASRIAIANKLCDTTAKKRLFALAVRGESLVSQQPDNTLHASVNAGITEETGAPGCELIHVGTQSVCKPLSLVSFTIMLTSRVAAV